MALHPPDLRLVPADHGHRAFVERLSAVVFDRYGDYGTMLPRMMRLPGMHTVVAEADGEPVGFAMMSPVSRAPGELDLAAIAVEPAWQSRGVGRLLLEHSEREALRSAPAGVTPAVRLNVAGSNTRARRVFEAAGFREVAGEPGRYPAGQRSLCLRKILAPRT
jgi:ribosomal protein S18 acetylase RimI-like enzyme